ncbi:MAG: ParA family protein [Pseudomonadota bacterium]
MSDATTSPKIIAVVNQKGGVGKTTTAINLAAAMAERGHQTLIVDLDPQGNASTGLGVHPQLRRLTTYELLLEDTTLENVVVETSEAGVRLVPSTTDLSSADIQLASRQRRSFILKKALSQSALQDLGVDHVFIDCPPSLNLLTVNAMVAAHSILVPLQSEYFALEGLSQLMLTHRDVRETANPNLRIEGIVLTMFDRRNKLSLQVEEEARSAMGELVFKTRVPRNVRVSEAPSFSKPVISFDPTSKGSLAYRALAQEILSRDIGRAA